MSRIDRGFEALGRVPSPELWEGIRQREPRPVPAGPSPGRRLGTVVVAFALAVAGVGFGIRAFRTDTAESSHPAEPTQSLTVDDGEPIPVGDYANAVAVGEGGVWLAVHSLEGETSEVVRLDPNTGDIMARMAVSSLPGWEVGGGGMIVADGSLWVAGSLGHDEVGLSRIDPSTNEVVETIQLGRGSAADVWVDVSGIWVLAFIGGGDTEVIRLDPSTHEVVARIPLPASWAHQVVASNGSIWVHGTAPGVRGDVYPNTIYQIDPATNELVDSSELPAPDFPLAADARSIWQRTRRGVARVDPAGLGIEAELETLTGGCCDFIVSDGIGGVWMLGRVGEGRVSLWHITAEGIVDREGSIEMPANNYGIAAALDAETMTFWIVQYRDSVMPLVVRPA